MPADALSAALQQAVRGAPMTGGVTVTLSLGGATLHEAPAVGDLLKLADARLYVAKAGAATAPNCTRLGCMNCAP
ncbi:hypothetical protein [Deinococcus multiflagellatus]|uniref:GGDEF domain-containing protein n=1 Tax=Deinococcus multiflagellatus TaxID=1656887 RepID=A0ABW1ZKQ1_9DEIO